MAAHPAGIREVFFADLELELAERVGPRERDELGPLLREIAFGRADQKDPACFVGGELDALHVPNLRGTASVRCGVSGTAQRSARHSRNQGTPENSTGQVRMGLAEHRDHASDLVISFVLAVPKLPVL